MANASDILSKNYVKVDVKDTIAVLLGALKKAKERYALVFNGKKYIGVITKKAILSERVDINQMKVANIVNHRSNAKGSIFVPTLEPDTDDKTICKLMAAANTHLLPVVLDDKVIGVVKAEDVLMEMAPVLRTSCEKIAKSPITATPDTKISTVFGILSKNHIDHLPIVDGRGTLTGMISVSDLIENTQLFSEKRQHGSSAGNQGGKKTGYGRGEKIHPYNLPVENYMGAKILCSAPPGTQVKDAINKMVKSNVGSIVLVNGNKPVGIVTYKDLLQFASK
jgi:CBS domain-containing protein